MKIKLIWIFIHISSFLFSSEAAKMFNSQTNLYQGANFSSVLNSVSAHKKNEKSKVDQRENDNLVGIPQVLLGNIFLRLAKLENFQKDIEAKEASRKKIASKRAANELGLSSKKNNTMGYLELPSKKDLDSEKMTELSLQVKNIDSKLEKLTLMYKKLYNELSLFSSNLFELSHSVEAEKVKKSAISKREEELSALSKRVEELSVLRVTDVVTMSKKTEEFSARIAALALQIDMKKGSERLDFFSAGTNSFDSLDSQNDDESVMPGNRVETRAQSSESTPNLSFQY